MTSDTTNSNVTHAFMEVGGELLSKPNALGDLLEQQGFPSTLIYCNTPSDTDLLEVLLKKRGIPASKLIGYVPPQKQQRAIERIASKELCALVVTDIAARSLPLKEFQLVINYSIQNDSDLYKQRCGLMSTSSSDTRPTGDAQPVERGTPAKMVSLVSPLDLANFHFVKKALGEEFTQLTPPSKEEIQASRAKNIIERAIRSPIAQDENYRGLAALILKSSDAQAAVATLLHSMLEQVPQLQADIERVAAEREFMDDDGGQPGSFRRDNRGGDRDNRGDRGGDRDNRDNRGMRGDRDGRGDRDRGGRNQRGGRDNRDNRGGGRYERNDSRGQRDDDNYGNQQAGGNDENYGGGHDNDMPRERHERRERPNVVRFKEDRLYIGKGAKHGFNQAEFTKLIKDHCGLDAEQMKRFSSREVYSFADFDEEVSQKVIDGLKGQSSSAGELFVTRAVTLTLTREAAPGELGEDMNGSHENADHENGNGHHEGESSQGHDDSMGDENIA